MKISMLRRHVEIHSRKLKQDYVDILRVEVYHGSNAVCIVHACVVDVNCFYSSRVGETAVACC